MIFYAGGFSHPVFAILLVYGKKELRVIGYNAWLLDCKVNEQYHVRKKGNLKMIVCVMKSNLPGANAAQFYEFMINAPQEVYVHWLPDEHHEFHIVKRGKATPVGDLLYFDQHISPKHRLKFNAVTKVADAPNRVVFQMRKFGVNIPGYLELDFCDTSDGLLLVETIRIGFNGFGAMLDPLIRLVFNKSFFEAMGGHHKREWSNLAEILRRQQHTV